MNNNESYMNYVHNRIRVIEPRNDKVRLNDAFKQLRKQNLIARQKFQCCQSCGYAALEGMVEARREKGKQIDGVVFYHQQDAENMQDGGEFCISYDSVTDDLTQEQVGHMVVAALEGNGLVTEWNGNPLIRVVVTVEGW